MNADQIEAGRLNISAIPDGFVINACPAPFLSDPLAVPGTNNTIDAKYCRYGCCIPCPAQNLVRHTFAFSLRCYTDPYTLVLQEKLGNTSLFSYRCCSFCIRYFILCSCRELLDLA